MTTQEVKIELDKNNIPWELFEVWMTGQTVGMDEHGEVDWFEYDVNRFIKGHSPMSHG